MRKREVKRKRERARINGNEHMLSLHIRLKVLFFMQVIKVKQGCITDFQEEAVEQPAASSSPSSSSYSAAADLSSLSSELARAGCATNRRYRKTHQNKPAG